MQDDLDSKAVSLTHFIFKIPSYKKIILYILLLSFFAGFALQAFLQIDG